MNILSAKQIVILPALFFFACGGSTPEPSQAPNSCESSAEELLAKSTACDETSFKAFKEEVVNWRKTCENAVKPITRDRLSKAVADAQKCVDEIRSAQAKKDECDAKIAAMEKQKGCDEESKCNALLDEVAEVTTLCEPSIKHGFDKQRADALIDAIKAQITLLKRQALLKQSIDACNKAESLTHAGNIDDALKSLVLALADMLAEPLEKTASEESADKEATAACGNALKTTVKHYLSNMTQRLDKKTAKKDPITWMSNYRHLSGTRSRLTDVGADTLVSNITEGLDKLLVNIDKLKNEIESEAIAKEEALVKDTLLQGADKCDHLRKEIERLDSKIKEHTKKKNDNKVRAYGSQLEKAKAKLEAFLTAVDEAKIKSPFDAKKTEKLLKKISKAGCAQKPPINK